MDSVYTGTFCALDLETTGVNPYRDRIIEIGIVKFSPARPDDRTLFHSLVNPCIPVSKQSYAIHGISDNDLIDKDIYASLADDVSSFIGDSFLIIQNPSFDLAFLHMEHKRIRKPCIHNYAFDTVSLSRKAYPLLANHKLHTVARHIGVHGTFHRALDDALCCADIFIHSLATIDPQSSLQSTQLGDICGFDTKQRMMKRLSSKIIHGITIEAGSSYLITYTDASGVSTERRIIAEKIYKKGAQTVVQAHCLLRDEIRFFNVKRIRKICLC